MTTGVAQVREQLGAVFKDALGKNWAVFPDTKVPDEITKPTLIIKRTQIEKAPEAPTGLYRNSLSLYVVSPQNQDEDALDEWLDEVLEVLDEQASVNWSTCTRATLGQNECFEITLTAISIRKRD